MCHDELLGSTIPSSSSLLASDAMNFASAFVYCRYLMAIGLHSGDTFANSEGDDTAAVVNTYTVKGDFSPTKVSRLSSAALIGRVPRGDLHIQ